MSPSFPASFARSLLALTLLVGGGWLPATASAAGASGSSPDGLWQLQAEAPAARPDRDTLIPTAQAQIFTADLTRLRTVLAAAPLDQVTAEAVGTKSTGAPRVEVSLPMPRKGNLARFQVEEVGIMAPALAARYPQIKTYRGVGVDDPSATLALDVTPFGFHAQIMSPRGWVYVNPYYLGGTDDVYASFYKREVLPDPAHPWECYFNGSSVKAGAGPRSPGEPEVTFGGSLRTYRLACAANHNYVATTGGTRASGQAAVVTIINRVSAIYESEAAIRLVLVANNDAVVYPDAATDPYSNSTAALNQNTPNLNSVIGANNYDIGHVFTTGSGGVAGLGVVCGASKGRGTTGLPDPRGDSFSVDYVAHEMGHQFGANHTFNGGVTNAGSCSGGNRSGAHAYEPGSGTTIMAYAGICGPNNDLQPHSDSFFHSESLSEILTFAAGAGGSCPVVTANGNSAPAVNAGPDYVIPVATPFTLTGAALDPEGDVVTYSWEERDRGTVQSDANAADDGTSPLFRAFTPVYSPSRTFPKASDLVNHTTTIGEKLPTLARTMNFRLTVRDNRANGGGTNSDDMVVTVVATAGPFRVTSPNTAVAASAGAPLGVTWNVANTDAAPVSTSSVNILLSLDGGYTYPITLAANTANDGSEIVILPAGIQSTTARIKVAAANSIYFDISDVNFSIN